MAPHALHTFIDTTLIQSSTSTSHQNSTVSSSSTAAAAAAADILQYAATLQVMLYTTFHNVPLMQQAMDEAIRVTQQQQLPSQTTTTTNTNIHPIMNTSTLFAMAWSAMVQFYQPNHYHHQNSSSTATAITTLQRCMDACRTIFRSHSSATNQNSHNHSTLLLTSIPLMMGIHLLHATWTHSWISHDRAMTFYTIDAISSKLLHVTGGTSSTSSSNNTQSTKLQYDRPIHTIHLDNPALLTQVILPQKLVAAQIYQAQNEISLSITTFLEVLQYQYDEDDASQHHQNHPKAETMETTTNDSRSYQSRSSIIGGGGSSSSSSVMIAIRNVALMASTTGSTQMVHHWIRSHCRTGNNNVNQSTTGITRTTLSQIISSPESGCIYQQAIVTYISLCDVYSISIMNNTKNGNAVFRMDLLFVFHEWAIRRHDLDHATAILTLLENYDRVNGVSTHGNGNTHMMMYHKILSLSRRKQYDTAIGMLRSMIVKYKRGQHRDLAWALLQLSRIYIESDRHMNKGRFVNALQPILECVSLSKQHQIYGLYNEALLVLAHVHLLMGQCHRAISIVQMILPTLLSSHHVSIQAEAYLILGKCRMVLAKSASNRHPPQPGRPLKLVKAAIQELERSRKLYERCHDCQQLQEIHYLLAQAYHQLSTIRTNTTTPTTTTLEQRRDEAATQYGKYTQRMWSSSTGSHPTVAQFMTDLTTRDGIMMLADRSFPME